MHPKYEVEKTYIATIDGKIGGNVCRRLVTQGVQLRSEEHTSELQSRI